MKVVDAAKNEERLPNRSLKSTMLSRAFVRFASLLQRFSSRLHSLRRPHGGLAPGRYISWLACQGGERCWRVSHLLDS